MEKAKIIHLSNDDVARALYQYVNKAHPNVALGKYTITAIQTGQETSVTATIEYEDSK